MDKIDEIRQRWSEAGQGWKIIKSCPANRLSPEWILVEGPRGFQDEMFEATNDIALSHRGDAEAIAHAPADVAYLLAEVDRLQRLEAGK